MSLLTFVVSSSYAVWESCCPGMTFPLPPSPESQSETLPDHISSVYGAKKRDPITLVCV